MLQIQNQAGVGIPDIRHQGDHEDMEYRVKLFEALKEVGYKTGHDHENCDRSIANASPARVSDAHIVIIADSSGRNHLSRNHHHTGGGDCEERDGPVSECL